MRLGESKVWAVVLAGGLLAGCAGGQYSLSDTPPAADNNAGMTGRWMLAAPGAPPCGMTFAGGGREGRVTPDGGCPGRFFLSRRWTLGNDGLTIIDPDGEPLAELKSADGRYEGKSATGLSVTLTRTAAPPG